MNLFELISSLLEPFFALVPRITHRPQTNEWLVIDRWFGHVRQAVQPQIYIPAVTHIEYIPKHEIPIDCGLQRVTSADDKPVAVNATAVIKIIDPVLCRDRAAQGYEELCSLFIRGVVCDLISGHNWSYLQELLDRDECFNEIHEKLDYYGIELVSFQVEDMQQVIPLSILQSAGMAGVAEVF